MGLVDAQLRCFDEPPEDMKAGMMVGTAENPHIVVAYGLEDSKDFVRLGSCSVDMALKPVGILVVT